MTAGGGRAEQEAMLAKAIRRTDHDVARGHQRRFLRHDFRRYAGKTTQLVVAVVDQGSKEPRLYMSGEAEPDRKGDQLDHIRKPTGDDQLRNSFGKRFRLALAQAPMVIDRLVGQPDVEFVNILSEARQPGRLASHGGELAAEVRV